MDLAEGTVFGGDYQVVRPLSAGGMGSVYVALQISTAKQRALKLMRPDLVADASMRQRFEQEARIGARIASEHVVDVVAAGVEGGIPYLVMELLEGELLHDTMQRRGALPVGEVAAIITQLCHAVGAAHAAGVVHRDLKPENIFMAEARRADSAFTVKVLDFGIAKLLAEGDVKDTAAIGSPIWLAPEQTERTPITAAADVWALGLIVFHLLTGRYYWRELDEGRPNSTRLMRQVLIDPLVPASERAAELAATLPSGFDDWFGRCVVRDPSARYATGKEAGDALALLLGRSTSIPVGDERRDERLLALAATAAAAPLPRVDTPFASAPTEVDTGAPAPRSLLGRLAPFVPLLAAIVWVAGVGYPGISLHRAFVIAGYTIYPAIGFFALGCLLFALKRHAGWTALAVGISSSFGVYTGWATILKGMQHAPDNRFRILHEGLFEVNAGRFIGLALAASLIMAGLLRAPWSRTREGAVRRGVAWLFGGACAALSASTRVQAVPDDIWSRDSILRSARVLALKDAATDASTTDICLVITLAAILAFWIVRVRALPGRVTLRGLVAGHRVLLGFAVAWLITDLAMEVRLATAVSAFHQSIAPEVELFAQLNPPAATSELDVPPSAPTLKLAKDKVALDAAPVGLTKALEAGTLETSLLHDVSGALAAAKQTDPPLLIMADRVTTGPAMMHALRVAKKAGVDQVGVLYTLGPEVVLSPDMPVESAYVVPTDFGMVRVKVASCPESDLGKWAELLERTPTVCVGVD